jgi:hypothetical protein
MTTTEMHRSMRELDSRTSDGIDVRLLWCQDSDSLFVAVHDGKTGEAFSVKVPQGERPLNVFAHPFAYSRLA